MPRIALKLQDFYVIKTSGIPVFAGCTGSEYCRKNMQQHELHAGFFSAVNSFAKEAFNGVTLEAFLFDQIQINMLSYEPLEVSIILVHSKDVRRKKIRKQLFDALELIKSDYVDILKSHSQKIEHFEKFVKDIAELRIITDKRVSDISKMILEKKEVLDRIK